MIAASAAGRESLALYKECNYFLQVADDDVLLLTCYQDVLTQGAAQFAESYYNYLFSYPSSAEALYRYEQEGGDVGGLVRTHLQHLLSVLRDDEGTDYAPRPLQAGRTHYELGIGLQFLLGAYRLYLSHLRALIAASPQIEADHRGALDDAVAKLVFRDLGMMLQGYWDAAEEIPRAESPAAGATSGPLAELLANIPQVLWSVDVTQSSVLYQSPATPRICPADGVTLVPCLERTVPEDRELVRMAWERALGGEITEVESRVQMPGGNSRWFRRRFYPYHDAKGKVVRVDGFMEDVTEAKLAHERLQQLATRDLLTGLANRTLWYDRLAQALATARRSGDKQVVVMLLDLNHFKLINDSLGHPAGDRILRQVALRLQAVLRDSDTLARLGGDEFAVLLPGIADGRRAAEEVGKKIHDCFVEPFWHDGDELYLGAAIGMTVYPDHGEDADTLLSRADIAMYDAKCRDGAALFFDPGSDATAVEHLQMSRWLRHALEREEFQLVYQPKVDMAGRRVCGVEALLRWNHPQRGTIPPDQFIPIAEQIGFIGPITDWVLVTALRQCREWRAHGLHLPVAVNVSARSLQSPRLVDKIRRALHEAGVTPDCLEIEITENALMGDLERGAEILTSLSALGVGVAIDDFGTGYSSLSYLKRLPIHTLKIDKSFLADMPSDDNDAVIVRSIIDLGHNLGYKVVAEGVEDREAWDLLEILGCDAVQGYHISRPLPEQGLAGWVMSAPWAARMN